MSNRSSFALVALTALLGLILTLVPLPHWVAIARPAFLVLWCSTGHDGAILGGIGWVRQRPGAGMCSRLAAGRTCSGTRLS